MYDLGTCKSVLGSMNPNCETILCHSSFTAAETPVMLRGAAISPLLRVPVEGVSVCTDPSAQLLRAPLSAPHPEPADLTEKLAAILHHHPSGSVHIMRHAKSQSAVQGQRARQGGASGELALIDSIDVNVQPLGLTRPGNADGVPLVLFQPGLHAHLIS